MTAHSTDYSKKLAAWLHDPAEKQLVLLRDPAGHEGGTSMALRAALSISVAAFDKRADWLASAADRPSWPRDRDGPRYQVFESVRFSKEPELIHPLSGDRLTPDAIDLGVDVAAIKAVSQDHFARLIQHGDNRRTFLAFWRFGPEAGTGAHEIGAWWPMLPADSRVPDHSIWSHVDAVSAIHTALAGDDDGPDQPALLVMSFGPVQGFIGQARSTSDLWAGSHLLATLVWEAMKPIVNDLGPDVMVFPALRGMPLVDQWLLEEDVGGAAFRRLFEEFESDWLLDASDTNPLFSASLPNKFMAIVPARRAAVLAERARMAIRRAARSWAIEAADKVFVAAGMAVNEVTRAQIDAQLADFPEVHWASAAWPIDGQDCRDVAAAGQRLRTALDAFHPALREQGVFDPALWQTLTGELKLEGLMFWQPNAGILYPAVHELAERALAATKANRPFSPSYDRGHRCTLTGEAEWLTHDRSLLELDRHQRLARSVWGQLSQKKKSWVKPGEHLSAIATLKRMWPTLFAERVSQSTGATVRRFVVSTHALALSTTLDRALSDASDGVTKALADLAVPAAAYDPVTLPKSLMPKVHRLTAEQQATLKRIPALMEAQADALDDGFGLHGSLASLFGDTCPESYYGLILMDGDRMGAWLSGNEPELRLPYRATWHSKVLAAMSNFERRDPRLTAYLDTRRAMSPSRHGAISRALGDFSIRVARHVVEECCKGKLLYAGGDDVLALVAVDDLFDCMQLLRLVYSGVAPDASMDLGERMGRLERGGSRAQRKLLLGQGFALLDGRLMAMMGHTATASMGAVVAHHAAPLGMVMRELRAAEAQAKNTARVSVPLATGQRVAVDRDAFCLRVLKRGGGAVSVTSPWWPVQRNGQPDTARAALALMKRLVQQLAHLDFSRAAVYRAQLWFAGLTDQAEDADRPMWRAQMAYSLAYQFQRQSSGDKGTARELAHAVVDFVCDVMRPEKPRTAIDDFLVTSEFFAREVRSFRGARRAQRAAPAQETGA